MASHHRLKQCILMPTTAVSSTTTYTSGVLTSQYLDNIGLQFNATGTANGTFSVQVSMDYEQDAQGNVLNAGNWIPLVLPSTPTLSGSATQIYVDLNQLSAPYLRVQYTNSSSTGSITVWAGGKGLN